MVITPGEITAKGKTVFATTQVQGSGRNPYMVTIYTDGSAYCTCPAWRNGKTHADDRTCKHTRKVSAALAAL